MAEWLEAQLLREMAPVRAPDSLWTRVQAERHERCGAELPLRGRASARRPRLQEECEFSRNERYLRLRHAERKLGSRAEALPHKKVSDIGRNRPRAVWMLWPAVAMVLLFASVDLLWQMGKAAEAGTRIESSDPAELRAWVKAKANVDIDLVCGGAGKIQFSGARLTHVQNELVAEISYEREGKAGLLLVSKKGASPPAMVLEASCLSCHVEAHGHV